MNESSSQLLSKIQSRLREEIIATKDWTNAMEKRNLMFHFGGVLGAIAMSYPMVIKVPSFSKVMSMSMSTGMWKNGGHSCMFGSTARKSRLVFQSAGMYWLGR